MDAQDKFVPNQVKISDWRGLEYIFKMMIIASEGQTSKIHTLKSFYMRFFKKIHNVIWEDLV